MTRTTIAGLILLLLLQQPRGSISGVAVRAGTSQPLPDLLVELWPTPLVVRTDSAGRFSFPGLLDESYVLAAQLDDMRTRQPVRISRGENAGNLVLNVLQAPAIQGSVYGPDGSRLAGAQVQAWRVTYSPLGPRLRSVLSVLTDDRGAFRLYRLRPGPYYVSAGYGDREQRAASAGLRLTPNLSPPDEGYPVIYAGGVFNPLQSEKVRLREDADAEVALYMKDATRLQIRGLLFDEGGPACASVALIPEGGLFDKEKDFIGRFCGSFQIKGVSPGVYYIVAMDPGRAATPVRVSVSSDNLEVRVGLEKTANISGRVSLDGRPAIPGGARIVLRRNSQDLEYRIEAVAPAAGTFLLEDVGPGRYDVLAELPANAYLQGARYGPLDVLAAGMDFKAASGSTLEISASTAGGVLDGTVADALGRPSPRADVVLVPMDARAREGRFKNVLSMPTGDFEIAGIPPGRYTAFAFERIEAGAWFALSYDARRFDALFARGTPVTIVERARQTVRLAPIPAEETAEGF